MNRLREALPSLIISALLLVVFYFALEWPDKQVQAQSVSCTWMYDKAVVAATHGDAASFNEQTRSYALQSMAWMKIYSACVARYGK